MHLSSASPRGGRGPRADVGTLQIVHFKVLVFPHPWGNFLLQSPHYLAKPSTQLASDLYFGSLNSKQTLGFFLEYYLSCSQSGENFNFSSRPEFPRFCFKSIRTDEEQGKAHYHDGLLNVLLFSEYSERLL